MINIGQRIFYNATTGDKLFTFEEASGDVQERSDITVDYIDLPFGAVSNGYVSHINPVTKEAVIIKFEETLSPEQQKIKELEDALLLATDNEVGGIL
ncbi:hypothetical protein [Lysinibacillus xylanilyticus]|uniref:hypothetical protein n=1 Tax=Lysinibacillus xylanilyticus TaxID=582475 RepID=UPI00380BFD9B